jgi:hypothetical protein
MTLYFKDAGDGYYEFADNAPAERYAHLTPCAQQVPPAKTPAQISQELERVLDQHIESVAHADRWDSRITCAMRAGYPNPWQNKAIAFGQWMDACYAHCIQVQADVAAGTRPVPTSAELIAELPVMVWPV